MKKIAVLMLAVMVASVTFGGIGVSWSNRGFLSYNDTEGTLFANQDTATVRILWDLVYTTSTSDITAPTLVEGTSIDAEDPVSYGSDQVLSRREWTPECTDAGVVDKTISATPSSTNLVWNTRAGVSGYTTYKNFDFSASSGGLYAAVFQFMSDGSVYYNLSQLQTGIDWNRTASTITTPENVNFNVAREYTKIDKELGKITQVPEPATMSLLGLGALAMVIRRKLRK
jgi:hypothetical protein